MSNFFNDSGSEFDSLGYYPYIESFNYILTENNKLITPPLVFGIHGKWGEGKTTFMNLIKERIKENFYTVEINPWEYGNNQNFITVFLSKLYKEVNKEMILRGDASAKQFLKAIFKPLKLSLNVSPIKIDYDFDKFTFDDQKQVIDSLVSENFAMKESISYILNHDFFNKKKVVVFIDDLDRCNVDQVMEVIESIKLIFNSKNCIFFMGCDINYIQGALANKYNDFIKYNFYNKLENDDSIIEMNNFSREYLEKIIQIPFYIPKIDETAISNYVESIIKCKIKKNTKLVIKENLFDMFQKQIQKEFISNLIIFSKINPRRIKRILNLTFLNYVFLNFKILDKDDINIDINLLALLCIVREVYPDYYKIKLSYEQSCIQVFHMFFERYITRNEITTLNITNKNLNLMNSEEIKIKDLYEDKVYELFELYFQYQKITNLNSLNKKIYNISIYISVSNISTSIDYSDGEWGDIGEIKSDITGKKLKAFLSTITSNSPAKNLLYWFFTEKYVTNINLYTLGIVKNVQIYVKSNEERKWIFRFDFDRISNVLYITFEWRNSYKTIIDNIDRIIKSLNYDSKKKRIEIKEGLSSKELEIIKNDLNNLIDLTIKSIFGEIYDEIASEYSNL